MTDHSAAIILAAGASRRMGRNKMLIEIDGVPLVRRAVLRATEGGLSPVIVVVGHEADRVRAAIHGLPCTFATNLDFTGPTSGSLHAGITALPVHVNAPVVMLVDMPFVTTNMIRRLTTA
ncbi:MAG: NTP transferase domain-containing protein, partial [Gemmatimonadota bacterium]